MKVNVAVVAHVQRQNQAMHTAGLTNANYVTVDDGSLGCDRNHRVAWEWHATHRADWAVVLEDDAIPVTPFKTQLHQALSVVPASIVSLYLGKLRPPHWQTKIAAVIREADETDAHWILCDHLLHGVGVAIRQELVDLMLDELEPIPVDEAISIWAQHAGHVIAYTWPSLIDHADTQTLVSHRDNHYRAPGRVAWRAGTRNTWSDRSVSV